MFEHETVTLAKKGVYRFTTKPGEDFAWARSTTSDGEDNVLRPQRT